MGRADERQRTEDGDLRRVLGALRRRERGREQADWSVIMKKRNTRISGDVTTTHQKYASHTGPMCHVAVMQ
jgi:hypothetical protein